MARKQGSLTEYRRKRDFHVTREPEGAAARAGRSRKKRTAGLAFVVQKHAASHLHYDLRLELGGVMRSWAVPRGPSSDPADRRLAIQVEDHPIEYNRFEGTIPEGEYGGGTVMLWDRGTYTADDALPNEDPEQFIAEELERGKLAFTFHGERLRGSYALVRTRRDEGGKAQWILLKHRDDHAREGDDLTERYDTSVTTGRTMDDIAAGRGGARTWRSNRAASAKRARPPRKPAEIPRKVLDALSPMKASSASEPPTGREWSYEPKYDGIRVVAAAAPDGGVVLLTRNGNDKSVQFPEIAAAMAALAQKRGSLLALDGELVGVRDGEVVRFESLQGRMHLTRAAEIARLAGEEPAALVAFDLLIDDGEPLLQQPWRIRRKRLETLFRAVRGERLRLGESSRQAEPVIAAASRHGWEGIIAKRVDAPYHPGARSRDWLKIKLENEQEFVIGGWSDPAGSRTHLGALLLGYYNPEGGLVYAGHTGTGFTRETLRMLGSRLNRLERKTSPFVNPPDGRGFHWVTPKLVAQVRFNEWTSGGKLRQPVFLGLRDDKDPREVIREPASAGAATLEPAPAARRGPPAPRRPPPAPPATEVVAQLAAIERAGGDGIVTLDGAALSVTSLGKPFFTRPTRTKGALLRYYAEMAPFILPAMAERPLVLKRFPNGVEGESFYQQTPEAAVPEGVRVESVELEGKRYRRLVGGGLATLLYTIQKGAISYDPWHGPWNAPTTVDYTVIDLDPGPGATFRRVIEVALAVRAELEALGLHGAPKTSGSSGIHIYLPLPAGTPSEAGQLLARLVAVRVSEAHPKIATVERMTRNRPRGTVYVDFLQNEPGKTIAGVYAARARPHATVSTPLAWDELAPGLSPRDFTIANVPARVASRGDLWREAMAEPNDLSAFTRERRSA